MREDCVRRNSEREMLVKYVDEMSGWAYVRPIYMKYNFRPGSPSYPKHNAQFRLDPELREKIAIFGRKVAIALIGRENYSCEELEKYITLVRAFGNA